MDWVAALAEEARRKPLARVAEAASKHDRSAGGVGHALKRQERRGLLERLADGVYLNKLVASVTTRDIVNELLPESYISLGTALAEWGLSSQNPALTQCVTIARGRKVQTASVNIAYRKISPDLFWGFTEKKARYGGYRIAEPEKALLDWIYFTLKDGLAVEFDEINFEKVSRSKPGGVREEISVDGDSDIVFSAAGRANRGVAAMSRAAGFHHRRMR